MGFHSLLGARHTAPYGALWGLIRDALGGLASMYAMFRFAIESFVLFDSSGVRVDRARVVLLLLVSGLLGLTQQVTQASC